MAVSGSFNTSAYSGRYLTFAWQRTAIDQAKNTTTISWTLTGAGSSAAVWYMAGPITLTIDGQQVYSSTGRIQLYAGTRVASGTTTITHAADGTKNFVASARAAIYTNAINCTGSGSWTLDAIPRYATPGQALTGRTETTISMSWSADAPIDQIQYSTNGGSTWSAAQVVSGASGQYTIAGLAAFTTYQIVTRARRASSKLWSQTAALAVQTYDYPHCTAAPGFTIGSPLTLTYYNPLSRNMKVDVFGGNSSIVATGYTTGNKGTGYDTPAHVNAWYASLGTNSQTTYRVRVTYAGVERYFQGGIYKAAPGSAPTISSVTFTDTNAMASGVTGDVRVIVQSQSTPLVTITGISGLYGATVRTVETVVQGVTRAAALSGSTATCQLPAINSAQPVPVTVRATDSRGVTRTVTVDMPMTAWQPPTATIKASRLNNFYDETTATVDAEFARIGDNWVVINYTYVPYPSGVPITGSATSGTPFTVNLDNTRDWQLQVTVMDGFAATKTYYQKIARGIPIIFFDRVKSSVGINCFPANSDSLEVSGINVLARLQLRRGETLKFGAFTAVGFTLSNKLYVTLPMRVQFDAGAAARFSRCDMQFRQIAAPGNITWSGDISSWDYSLSATGNAGVYLTATAPSGVSLGSATWMLFCSGGTMSVPA